MMYWGFISSIRRSCSNNLLAGLLLLGALGCGGGSSSGGSQPPERPDPAPTPSGPTAWVWDLPPGFPVPRVPAGNPMTEEKFQLGRHLFYETKLSVTEDTSCSSCHDQSRAFTDGKPRAIGATGEVHPRNAQGLANIAYAPTLTWNNPNETSLANQLLTPLFGEDPVELGLSGLENLVFERLSDEELYQELFGAAFPDDVDPFTIENLAMAIEVFELALISGRSPYDRFIQDGDADALSEGAKRGMEHFFSENLDCTHCHGGANFASALNHEGNQSDRTPFENNGLYNIGGTGNYPADNQGLYEFSGRERDKGRMKPPSLRNICVTEPYMHDGSIATLEEVIDHYERGGTRTDSGPLAGDGRDSPNKSDFITGFLLSRPGRADVVEFLCSLTDDEFLANPRFSDPFAPTSD
ncbi:MAG: di-heme enzyme [Candidatus Binatia bacterium]|nr:di-heme enzyme [Candidatus Binatia bacterium]MDG1958095.1 di-heme enzyme [Candidatus Binatia bacterium]